MFSSSPDRGLDFLLSLWPDVRKQVPDAELAYCYSDVYDAVAAQQPQLRRYRDHVKFLANQDGVTNLGSLSQPQLARELEKSGVWLNPGWCSPHSVRFNETYCIGAVEAAAAGCWRVVSGWGALPERNLSDNQLCVCAPAKGDDTSSPDAAQWVDAIVECLQAPAPGPSQEALEQTWDRVAGDVESIIAAVVPAQAHEYVAG